MPDTTKARKSSLIREAILKFSANENPILPTAPPRRNTDPKIRHDKPNPRKTDSQVKIDHPHEIEAPKSEFLTKKPENGPKKDIEGRFKIKDPAHAPYKSEILIKKQKGQNENPPSDPQELPMQVKTEPPKSENQEVEAKVINQNPTPLKNALTLLKYKKPNPKEKPANALKKPNPKDRNKPVKTNPPPNQTPQQTITTLLKKIPRIETKPDLPKTRTQPEERKPPPYLKQPKLVFKNQNMTPPITNQDKNSEKPNQEELNQEKTSENQTQTNQNQQEAPKVKTTVKPTQKTLLELINKKENLNQIDQKTKPVNKPNLNRTKTTKPAQDPTLSKKLKTMVVQGPDLKQFLERKQKERELKQNKINIIPVEEPAPSIPNVSATLACSSNSLPTLLNNPMASIADAAPDVIIERDCTDSAHRGDLAGMSGDLLLAIETRNLGDKPIV